MFKLFVAVFLLLLPVSTVYAASYARDVEKCAKIMEENPAEVTVTYNFGEIKYDFSKSSKEIPLPQKGVEVNGVINGLTEFSPSVGLESILDVKALSEDRYCLYPKKVKVTIWYEPKVYIAKDLKKGSCRYELTMRHEQTHLQIAHQIILMSAQALKVQSPLILKRVGPQVSRQPMEAKMDLETIYQQRVNELGKVFASALEQKNKELDTEENYAKEDTLCKSAF